MRISSTLSPGLLVFLAFLVSCGGNRDPEKTESRIPPPDPTRLLRLFTREADDAGRFLAGLPGRQGSPYREFEGSPAWIEHATRFGEQWASFQRTLLPQMQRFHERELSGPPIQGALVFYPFGGPDALTVLGLFPDQEEYVLVSLEPPGTVPRLRQSPLVPLDRQLPRFRKTMESLLTKSFFVTREMDRQLRGQITDGVAPLLLVQLVRSGNTVLSYGYIGLDESGRVIGRPQAEKRAAFGGNRGLVIEFQKDGGGRKRFLYYFSVNLDDKHLSGNSRFLKYVAAFRHPVTLLKSTSYMLHKEEFSAIRRAILECSAAVVQDDSGVPFRMFDPDRWQVQLYGDYVQPYGSFKYRRQPDLRAAYHLTEVKPLELQVGYGSRRTASNLLVARRRGQNRGQR